MRRVPFAVLLLVTLVASSAEAAPLSIASITGAWQNPVGGNIVSMTDAAGQGTDSVRWGHEWVLVSGYDFTPGPDIANVPSSTPFVLGTFRHINSPILTGTEITGIEYALSFLTTGQPTALAATVQFSHNETVNSGPCPAGSVTECDDVVTITTPILSALITSGTDSYLFKLLGFSKDGKTFSSVYMSPEGGDNAAQLYAEVTPAPVPEPGSLVLLGSGLMGLAAAARRRNRRKA